MKELFIGLAAFAVCALLVWAVRLIRVEKRSPEEEGPEESGPEEGEEPQELVNLTELFAGPEPEEEPAKQTECDGWKEQLEQTFDRLTGLSNNRYFQLQCRAALSRARREGQAWAAICFDLDRFRFLNDLRGYSIGDYILTQLAQGMIEVFSAAALLTRLSADHFVALFPYEGEEAVEEYFRGMKRCCEKIRGDLGFKGAMRVSMGVAVTMGEGDYDPGVLLAKADIARHCLKVSRGDSWELYHAGMLESYLHGESALEDYKELQYADEVLLYYVPLADLSRETIAGCELVACWKCEVDNNQDRVTLPQAPLPVKGRKIIYQACRMLSRWRKSGREPLMVTVPLPFTDLFLEDFDGFVARCLSEFQLEPQALLLLVEKSLLCLEAGKGLGQLKKLREIGVRLGLYGIDAGTGTLNLADADGCLTFAKLHKSLLQQLEHPASPLPALLEQVRKLGLEPIAEGVDSQEAAARLQEMGVCLVQGRYGGSPAQGEDFAAILPELMHRQKGQGGGTVVLDDVMLNQGDYRIY